MSERELLAELARADAACAATRSELDALLRETLDLRARADEIASMLAAAPAERKRLSEALAAAEAEAKERAEALAAADVELAAVERRRDPERAAAARRSRDRAQDDLTAAERRVASCLALRQEHMRAVEAAEREVPEVEAQAGDLAGRLRGRPRLAPAGGTGSRPRARRCVGVGRRRAGGPRGRAERGGDRAGVGDPAGERARLDAARGGAGRDEHRSRRPPGRARPRQPVGAGAVRRGAAGRRGIPRASGRREGDIPTVV